jgi:hypothetical protein
MIVKTADNLLYRIDADGNGALARVWYGIRVRKLRGKFVALRGAKLEAFLSKGSRIVTYEGE